MKSEKGGDVLKRIMTLENEEECILVLLALWSVHDTMEMLVHNNPDLLVNGKEKINIVKNIIRREFDAVC